LELEKQKEEEVKEEAGKKRKEKNKKKKQKKGKTMEVKKWIKVFGKKQSERMPTRKVWDHMIDVKEGFVP